MSETTLRRQLEQIIGNKNTIGPEVLDLIDYLQKKGAISNTEIIDTRASSPEASFNNDKRLRLFYGRDNRELTNEDALMHEIVHALVTSNEPSRTNTIAQLLQDSSSNYNYVFPSSWEKGHVDNPMAPVPWLHAKDVFLNQMKPLLIDTMKNQIGVVKQAIPKGKSWSGLTKETEFSPSGLAMNRKNQEANAYYLTDRQLENRKERTTEFLRFLRDYDIPWNLIDALKKKKSGEEK